MTGNLVVSGSPTALPQGSYYVHITDANGCVVTLWDSIGIHQLSNIQFTTSTTIANCTNGTASVMAVTGGTGPYTYMWSNGLTSQQISNLTQGMYSVTVTDVQGCHNSDYVYVQQTPTITANTVPTAATCLQNDGSAITFGSGGTPPYSYSYSNGQTTQNINGLVSGSYQVNVTDANGCISGMTNFYVSSSTPITVTYNTTSSSCTAPTGSATLTISGGQAPYTTNWASSPPQIGSVLSNVAAGNYYFTVTDANGCIRTGTIFIPDISNMSAYVWANATTCPLSTGGVTINAYSTNPPLTYAWSNGSTGANLSNVPAGTYSCVITDAVGCQLKKWAVVTASSPITLNYSVTQASCKYVSDGSIILNPTGGTAPYTYNWLGGNSNTITNLAGDKYYWVDVTDANGCSQQAHVYVPYNALNDSCYCTVTGTVYYDANGNCTMDMGETPVHNIQIKNNNTITGYNIVSSMFTNSNGAYSFTLPSGNYNIQEVIQYQYPPSSCQSNNNPLIINASSGCTYTVDFANGINPLHDLHVINTHYNLAVPGNNYVQQVILQNDGTVSESGIVAGYAHDGQLSLVNISGVNMTQPNSSLAPDWYNATGISLAPASATAALITYAVSTNIPIGTMVNFWDTTAYTASMSNWLNDYSPWNNIEAYDDIVMASFDPNMKEVSPKGIGPQGYITSKDTVLDYVIHFQNTGSWYANKVVVVDTLDTDLDWETLKPGYSERTYVATMDNNGVVSFTFNNINLPPQSWNSLARMGTIAYSIHTKKNLPQGTQFTNSAAIFFDYNSPVITNTTVNTLNDAISVSEVKSSDEMMSIFPNPANENCTVKISVGAELSAQLSMYGMNGELVHLSDVRLQQGENTLSLKVSGYASGLYVVRVSYGDKMHYCKLSVTR